MGANKDSDEPMRPRTPRLLRGMHGLHWNRPAFVCPRCGVVLGRWCKKVPAYCPSCGQMFEWHEEQRRYMDHGTMSRREEAL